MTFMPTAMRVRKVHSKRTMTDAHKAALAKGRDEGRAVRLYLEALESSKPRRGRRRTPESIKKRLAVLDTELMTATALNRLHLLQEQRDLEAELARDDEPVDLAGLEKGFIKAARAYGERKGIAYSSWRTAGVSPAVLAQAGIARTRG
jgi:hypothetical protein